MITEEKRKDLKNKLESSAVSIKDRTVFSTRYGLYDGIYKSTEDTAHIHGMTSSNVRLILSRVKKLLKIKD